MKRKLSILNRATQTVFVEKILGENALHFLYPEEKTVLSGLVSFLAAHFSFVSTLYGLWHKTSFSKKKIAPFVENYSIQAGEFDKKIEEFTSFNDFFIRTLKKESRPLAETAAILPADARYHFFTGIERNSFWEVKGKSLNLETLLGSSELASFFEGGTALFARLCPVDYHRFHFPCSGVPRATRCLNGPLYSVHPWSFLKNIQRLQENKRNVTEIDSDFFGKVVMVEIGATNVGSIRETFTPNKWVEKGSEKGYFSLGGSALFVFFEKEKIELVPDLKTWVNQEQEVYALFGQSLGEAKI